MAYTPASRAFPTVPNGTTPAVRLPVRPRPTRTERFARVAYRVLNAACWLALPFGLVLLVR